MINQFGKLLKAKYFTKKQKEKDCSVPCLQFVRYDIRSIHFQVKNMTWKNRKCEY